MNSPGNKKQNWILIAAVCIIIITGLGALFWIPGHMVANMYFIPAGIWSGIPVGTFSPDIIPMTVTSMITPAFATSFLYEFGAGEPGPAPELPRMVDYLPRKEVIDGLMIRANVNGTEDSIIGMYELTGSRLLLIDRGTSVTEILDTGEEIHTFTLVPEQVGSRRMGPNATGHALQKGVYNFTSDYDITIKRVHLVLPSPANGTAPMYIVTKTQTAIYLSPEGTAFATFLTTGKFYVLYGQRVERVVASPAYSLDPSWIICSQQTMITNEDGTMGRLNHTVKLARGSERMIQTHLIATGPYVQVHDGTSAGASWWLSRDSTGCSG
ncbi:MAG: hypothetical protein M0R30_09525 [Methanoregula sp.]|uniref:hypothetical protein n=1 Tax=Methanoregula sp. TaxID=2052170 RepID=UPI0025EA2BCD|nr:hypothetical protein [Methanoregula sp.]MCK9631871.1 hypothetical protein [Methanoregula sp.]